METTTIDPTATIERLERTIARLQERVEVLEAERRDGTGGSAAKPALFHTDDFRHVAAVHRSVLAARSAELRQLLDERETTIARLRDARRELRNVYGEIEAAIRIRRGDTRPFPEIADREAEEEAARRLKRLREREKELEAEIREARKRVKKIGETIARDWYGLRVVRLPAFDQEPRDAGLTDPAG